MVKSIEKVSLIDFQHLPTTLDLEPVVLNCKAWKLERGKGWKFATKSHGSGVKTPESPGTSRWFKLSQTMTPNKIETTIHHGNQSGGNSNYRSRSHVKMPTKWILNLKSRASPDGACLAKHVHKVFQCLSRKQIQTRCEKIIGRHDAGPQIHKKIDHQFLIVYFVYRSAGCICRPNGAWLCQNSVVNPKWLDLCAGSGL